MSTAVLALVTITAVVVIGGAPAAWWLLGLCGVVLVSVLIVSLAEGRYFEPLTVVAAFGTLAFVVRPLYLFINSTELLSFIPPRFGSSPVKSLIALDNSEVAFFASTRLHGPLQPALTRAIAACAVFVVAFVAAYLMPLGKRLGARLATAGRRAAHINVRRAVIISLAIGLIGQAAIVHKTGGISKAANSQIHQNALQAGFVYYVLAGFAIAAVIAWAAWDPPRTPLAWVGFIAAGLESCIFFVLVGSRTHVLAVVLVLVVVLHYRWRKLRLRTVVAAFVVGLMVAAAMLAVRQATSTQSFAKALGSAPAYIVHPRGAVNNITQFDQIFYATSTIGVTLHYKHGGWLGEAFASYIPRFLDPHKPRPPDITFRQDVFGNAVGAGRPPTAVGDLYYDFGFWGIAIGAMLIGVFGRMLLGLLSDGDAPGREFRLALYGLSLFVIYELVSNGYAIALGYVLTLIVPFLVTVLLLGRVRSRFAGAPVTDPERSVSAAREHALR